MHCAERFARCAMPCPCARRVGNDAAVMQRVPHHSLVHASAVGAAAMSAMSCDPRHTMAAFRIFAFFVFLIPFFLF